MKKFHKALPVIAALGLVSACGGGGGDSGTATQQPATSTLSASQQAFEKVFTESNSYAALAWILPSSGTATSSSHHLDAVVPSALAASPKGGAQTATFTRRNFANVLPDRDITSGYTRHLVNGRIVNVAPSSLKISYAYSGDDVQSTQLADDNTTGVAKNKFVIETIPLTGIVNNTPAEYKTASIIGQIFNNTALYKPSVATVSWLPGSAIHKVTQTALEDRIQVTDCTGPTSPLASPATACGNSSTPVTTIEQTLGSTITSQGFVITGGAIQTKEGVRMWVANVPVATTSSSTVDSVNTANFKVFFELGGKVYNGFLTKAGTVTKTTRRDGTVVDYGFRFSVPALETLKSVITF